MSASNALAALGTARTLAARSDLKDLNTLGNAYVMAVKIIAQYIDPDDIYPEHQDFVDTIQREFNR